MKKKVLAFLLASTMVIEPFTVASAADFSDGMGQDTVQFSDDAEDVPEVENDDVDQFGTDAAGEGEEPTETHVQIGDKVWVDFDNVNGIATISGEGSTWDYLLDGTSVPDKNKRNPFVGKNFEKIIIQEGITRIGNYLFFASSDTENSDPWDWKQTGIKEVVFSNTITEIGDYSFEHVDNMSKLELPDSIVKIGNCTFGYIKSLDTIKLNQGLKKIGYLAFAYTAINNVELPNSVSELGESVFEGCKNLTQVTGFENVTVIPDSLFANCPIKNYNFENVTEIGEFAFWNSEISELNFSNKLKTIKLQAFLKCNNLKQVTIPDSVINMNSAFRECENLQQISLSNNLSEINSYAFYKCQSLIEITISQNIKKIYDGAFADCSRLKKVTFCGNTECDSGDPFEECVGLEEIVGYDDSYAEKYANNKGISFTSLGAKTIQIKIGDTVTANVTGDTMTIMGNGKTYDYFDLWDGINSSIKYITIDDGVTYLGDSLFYDFNILENIKLPESLEQIGEYTFKNCTSLTNLILPDSITEIAGEAFSNCVSLGKVTLPKNLTLLGNGVFENCNAEIIFPASLKCIPIMGDNAVTKVNIPEGVKIIGEDAFWACSNLKEITLPSTITNIERSAFFNTPITEFVYPQNIDNIPASAFGGTKLTEFSVPDNVKEIDDGAFYNCTDLKKITIPEFVTYIGNDVFKNCRNLVIYGKRDSVAERYAYINNIKFVSGQYKVVFKDNGRTVHTYYIDEGGSVLTPPTLKEKPGYTLSWDADYTNIQEDMVINAVWTKKDNGGGNTTIIVSPSETNKYTVTFKDRGEVIKTEKVKSGDAAEYPFITRSGYKLSWDKDFSKVTANITVNAVWTVIKPEKVTSLTAESGKKSIALSWDETEYAGYYLVYRKADSEKEYTQVAKTTKILWTDSKAVPGTQYSYKVVAVRSLSCKKYQGAESDVVTTKIGTPQIGDTYSVGDLNYKLTGTKKVTVTGLAKVTDTLVIPSSVTIGGKVYKVTAIQDKAFYRNEDIVNVTIGNNVVNVGKYAFYQCSGLETVKFGKRVAIINTCAFTQCPNLENVTLPSSIRKIGAKAFYHCTSIKIFKINGSALEYVGKKGLAINKTVTLRLPKKVYTRYKKLIKSSGVYSKTKFVKF
ncbi:hypothetical protein DXD85_10765 [Ruminococcus sp. TM09-4]|nr:hypothetical protein DXD85_10765 [Ruminococcus sp. TM09-4]